MLLTLPLAVAPNGLAGAMDISAAATQIGGGVLGTAVVILLVYWQYRRRPSTFDGKAESAGIAMIEAIRADSTAARAQADAAQENTVRLHSELRERDRLARHHEAYDRKLLDMLSRAGLLTDDLGVPPPLVPPLEEEAPK